jgi:hypothetical protein
VWEGRDSDLDWVLGLLENEYELKNRGRLGMGPKDLRKIDMLGRVIEVDESGITWAGDPRHTEILKEYFGMNDQTKALNRNGYEEVDGEGGQDNDEELSGDECKSFRMLAARLNYMAQDNPAIQYPAKEICRNMSRPRLKDFTAIKRLIRFIIGIGEVKFRYEWQDETEAMDIRVFVDSDWAGCRRTRRSTSGGVMKVGRHVLKTWSCTQATIATSSGEAELLAMYEGATRGLGLRSVMEEMGLSPCMSLCRICTDSSVAKSFVSTRGLGRMRHLEVKLLWLQDCVQRGRVRVGKVPGVENVADVLTKYHNVQSLERLLTPHQVEMAARTMRMVGPRGGVEHSVPPTPSDVKYVQEPVSIRTGLCRNLSR